MPTVDVGKKGSKKLVLDEVRVWDIVVALGSTYGADLFILLEKAQAMPEQGVASTFQYGTGYGVWRMALTAGSRTFGFQWDLVHPATWGKAMLNGIEGDDTKGRAVLKCGRALPGLDLRATARSRTAHTGLADAGCMALYGEHLRRASR